MNATTILLLATSTLVGAAAHAQSPACEMLKRTLAARIEATGVRGYSLEAVPAGVPVPTRRAPARSLHRHRAGLLAGLAF